MSNRIVSTEPVNGGDLKPGDKVIIVATVLGENKYHWVETACESPWNHSTSGQPSTWGGEWGSGKNDRQPGGKNLDIYRIIEDSGPIPEPQEKRMTRQELLEKAVATLDEARVNGDPASRDSLTRVAAGYQVCASLVSDE